MFNNARPALSKTAMIEKIRATGINPVTTKLAGRNTLDYTDSKNVRRIRLHDTDIVAFYPSGSIDIFTGGFNTKTSRARMNEFLPANLSVFTSKGVLYISDRTTNQTKPMRELATIDPDGSIRTDMSEAKLKRIQKQLNAFMKAWKATGLPTDSNGDPWVQPDPETLKYAESYVTGWIESKYVFLTFYVNALRFHGLSEVAISHFVNNAFRNGLDKMALQRIRRYARACIGLEC